MAIFDLGRDIRQSRDWDQAKMSLGLSLDIETTQKRLSLDIETAIEKVSVSA